MTRPGGRVGYLTLLSMAGPVQPFLPAGRSGGKQRCTGWVTTPARPADAPSRAEPRRVMTSGRRPARSARHRLASRRPGRRRLPVPGRLTSDRRGSSAARADAGGARLGSDWSSPAARPSESVGNLADSPQVTEKFQSKVRVHTSSPLTGFRHARFGRKMPAGLWTCFTRVDVCVVWVFSLEDVVNLER